MGIKINNLKNLVIAFFVSCSLQVLVQQSLMLEEHWWIPDGAVRAIVEDTMNKKVYLGGDFNYVGPYEPYGTGLNISTGTPNFTYANPNGSVLSRTVDMCQAVSKAISYLSKSPANIPSSISIRDRGNNRSIE